MVESLGLALLFWYGILHAFGPDHLTAIADFSIGKERKKTMMITIAFAIGHGLSLFVFAKILESVTLSDELLRYADVMSAGVIVAIGCYLLMLVVRNKIHVNIHGHGENEHLHIWFGDEHDHEKGIKKEVASVFTIGLLMGIGGVRGMLVTLGCVAHHSVDALMIFAFTAGVMVVFLCFGGIIAFINKNFLHSQHRVRGVFAAAGVVSVVVGSSMILG